MNQQPLVTIAVAAYNVEKFIRKGMDFVFAQTYSNVEIILVDDGSTDSTSDICDELKLEHNNLTVIHKKNGGLGSARNTGIEHAHGKYIYFFDVDDAISPDLIEYNVYISEKYKSQLNIFSFHVLNYNDPKDNGEDIVLEERFINDNEILKKVYCDKLLFTKHGNGFVWNKFYLLSFIKDNKLKFGNQKIQQDEPFNMQLYPILKRVYISSKVLYKYFIYSSGNNGTRFLMDKFEIVTEVFYKFINFYNVWEIKDKRVLDYIYNRYWNNIIQSLTSNMIHKDNPMKYSEKINHMKKIIESNEVKRLIKYEANNSQISQSIYYRWIKAKQPKKILRYSRIRIFFGYLKNKLNNFLDN